MIISHLGYLNDALSLSPQRDETGILPNSFVSTTTRGSLSPLQQQHQQQGRSRKRRFYATSPSPSSTPPSSSPSSPSPTEAAAIEPVRLRQINLVRKIVSSGKAKKWKVVAKVLEDAKNRDDLPFNVYIYGAAITAVGRCGRWKAALALLQDMKDDGIIPDQTIYGAVIDACNKSNQCETALNVFMEMTTMTSSQRQEEVEEGRGAKKNNIQPNVYCYSSAITACAKLKDYSRALQLLEQMQFQHGFQPNAFTLAAVIDACNKAGKYAQAISIFEKMTTTTVTSASAIKTTAAEHDGDVVVCNGGVSTTMTVKPNLCCYNSVITACVKWGKLEQARAYIMQMQQKHDIQPDVITYSTLMDGYARSENAMEALLLLQKMQQSATTTTTEGRGGGGGEEGGGRVNVRPNTRTYNTAITACGRGQRLDEALRLFEQMKELTNSHDLKINNSDVTFNTFSSRESSNSNNDSHKRSNGRIGNDAVVINTETYNAIIGACVLCHDLDKAMELFEDLKSLTVKLNRKSLVGPTAKQSQSTLTKQQQQQQQQQTQEDRKRTAIARQQQYQQPYRRVRANLITYNTLIAACGNSDSYEHHRKAVWLFNELKSEPGIQPDLQIYNTVISACHSGKKALALLAEMQDKAGLTPDVITYSAVLAACAYQPRKVKETIPYLLADMTDKGIAYNRYIFNSALTACSSAGADELALSLIAQMTQAGYLPDDVSYCCVISACAKAANLEMALHVLRTMEEEADGQGSKEESKETIGAAAAMNIGGEGRAKARKSGVAKIKSGIIKVGRETAESGRMGETVKGDDGGGTDHAGERGRHRGAINVAPSVIHYNAAIKACSYCDRFNMAVDLLKQMKRRGIAADRVSYTSAIAACLIVVKENKTRGSTTCTTATTTATTAINGSRTVMPPIGGNVSTTSTTTTFTANKMAENIVVIVDDDDDDDDDDDVKTSKVDEALALFKEMEDVGILPDAVAYDVILKVCSQAGRYTTAMQLLRQMKKQYQQQQQQQQQGLQSQLGTAGGRGGGRLVNVKPTVNHYNTVINACGAAEAYDKVLSLFGEMKGAGIRPSVDSYNAVLNAFEVFADHRNAHAIFVQGK